MAEPPHLDLMPTEPPDDPFDAALALAFGPDSKPPGCSADGEATAPLSIVEPPPPAQPLSTGRPDGPDGRYELLDEIARGGMGSIWRGRDETMGRDVAVKVLLERHAARAEFARRFEEEARIAGRLQHPGVVPVYEIGRLADRRPFFTMKLIEGQTLAKFLAARPGPAQELPRFLHVFEQVCQAIAYAHSRGIIHRDLKPANIMVGAFGEVQVMDWGLAKVIGESRGPGAAGPVSPSENQPDAAAGSSATFNPQSGVDETNAGSVMGTPSYMAPEQARGENAQLDERCDVIGLGAILCEILTGKPPFTGLHQGEVRRKAAQGELAETVVRLQGCGADPELIGLARRCLAADTADRPRNAGAVAQAVNAYLDSVAERLRTAELAGAEARARAEGERKRRRLAMALAMAVLLAVTALAGFVYVRQEEEYRQARLNQDVNDAYLQAMTLREQARAARGAAADGLAALARQQAYRAAALAGSGRVAESLAASVRALTDEMNEEERDRRVLARLEEVRLLQADVDPQEGRFLKEETVPYYRAAFADYGLRIRESPVEEAAARLLSRPPEVRAPLVAALDDWFRLLRPQDAEDLRWLAFTLRTADPDPWRMELRTAAAPALDRPPDEQRARLVQLARDPRAAVQPPQTLRLMGNLLLGVGATGPGIELFRMAQTRYPGDFWINHNLGMALLHSEPPDLPGAIRFLSVAVAIRPDSAAAHLNVAIALTRDGRPGEALSACDRALAAQPGYASAYFQRGIALKAQGKLAEAAEAHRKVLDLNPRHAMAHNNLGTILFDQGQHGDAVRHYLKAIELNPRLYEPHSNLGNVLVNVGRIGDGIATHRRAVGLKPDAAEAHLNLGAALERRSPRLTNPADRRRQYQLAVAEARAATRLRPGFAAAHDALGADLYQLGHYDEAAAVFRRALELQSPTAARNLGVTLLALGKPEEAAAALRHATALRPREAEAHYFLGVALAWQGQWDAAATSFRRTVELKPDHAEAHCDLADMLRRQGAFALSLAAFRRGHGLSATEPDWRHPSATWVRDAERLTALEPQLRAIVKGAFRPVDTAGRLAAANLCYFTKHYVAAARHYREAYALRPELGPPTSRPGVAAACGTAVGLLLNPTLPADHFLAVCAAAQAGRGAGADGPELSEDERAHWRRQARGWLRADLALYEGLLRDAHPDDDEVARVCQSLRRLRCEPDLAGIRDREPIADLPSAERQECRNLWAEADTLLQAADNRLKQADYDL